MENPTKIIDKVAYLKLVDGQILITRSKGKDKYYIPGGKREGEESDEATLLREIKEELSVDILPPSIRYIGTFSAQADGKASGVQVQMTCYTADYEGELKASHEIAEIDWFHYKDIDKVSHVDKIIFNYLRDEGSLT